MDVKKQKRRAVVLILIAGVLWGTSGIFVNFLSPIGFSSIQLTAVRATVSSVFIVAFMLVKSRKSFSAKPRELLIFLAKHRGKVVSPAELYEGVWKEEALSTASNIVTVHMLGLRRKLEDNPSQPKIVRTVWGKGYQID